MDVPLALNDIGIRMGFKGYSRKSSAFDRKADVVGLSAFYTNVRSLMFKILIL